MQITIQGLGFNVTDAIADHARTRLSYALNQHEGRINRVEVALKDVNGPRGGVGKVCRVLVRLVPRGLVMVKESQVDIYAAVSKAATRAKNAVGRRISRRKEKRA